MPHPPHTQPAAYPNASPRVLASRIKVSLDDSSPPGVALLGLPSDLGVRLNHGRPGSAGGPGAVRAALSRYGVAEPFGLDWPRVYDAGDVTAPAGDDEATLRRWHERVRETVTWLRAHGHLVIGVGGGHDHTLPLAGPVAHTQPDLAVLYVDAHLDVRDTPGSGMPFRRLVEDHGVRDLRVVGLNPLANSREHVEWFKAHGGKIIEAPRGRIEGPEGLLPRGPFYLSIDLDGIDGSAAPGVSALNPAGLSVHDVAALAHAAGRSPMAKGFDIMELNPAFDVDGRTSRVAAHLVLELLRGVALRA